MELRDKRYFFDTYAFFEIMEGNQHYADFQNATGATTIFNLAELNYALKREKGKHVADDVTKKYAPFLTEVTLQDILAAMDERIKNKKLSIPDAIGYVVAQRLGIPFLTGGKEFKNMANVIFVQ